MARIRTIKPEFFTSEDIVFLSPLARLLYIALWCESDKEGRMVWKPATFKLRYMPGDSCDIDALCKEIADRGLVVLYGNGYAYIPQFSRHQHVNPRESISVLPEPYGFVPDRPRKISADVREEVMERDGRKCVRCNSTEDLTLDHILPQSISGPHITSNLRCMCRACNSARPVSGKGLVDDLAIDGLSIEILRKQFGIDVSARVGTRANLDVHAQGGREGKGRERKDSSRVASCDDLFDLFWNAYPSKVGKIAAKKAFDKINPEKDLVDLMVKAIAVQQASTKWKKNGGEFIPNPATWLNAGQWLDGVPASSGAEWFKVAGFTTDWEAENANCYPHNADKFRDGKKILEAA